MIGLVRKTSDTPNITNKDDARMIRYAYGGYDGIVKGYGSEVSAHPTLVNVQLGSGRIVLQGWEVDIDEGGVNITLIPPANVLTYYTIYLELNLLAESCEIKSVYGFNDYPTISTGDDLTEMPNGIARLPLYHARLTQTTVPEIERVAKVIPYISDVFEEDRQTVKKATNADIATKATNADIATKIKCTRKAITIDTPVNTIFEDFKLDNYRRYAIEFSYKLSNGSSVHCFATGIAYEGVLTATAKHYFPSIMETYTFEIVLQNVDLTYNSQFTVALVNGTGYSGNVFDISAIYILEKIEE